LISKDPGERFLAESAAAGMRASPDDIVKPAAEYTDNDKKPKEKKKTKNGRGGGGGGGFGKKKGFCA